MDISKNISELELLSNKETILSFDMSHSIELTNLGFKEETLIYFKEQLGISKERKIPIFRYFDIDGNFSAYSVYAATYRNHVRINQTASYFIKKVNLHPSLVQNVIICPDPLELMSYYQLRSFSLTDTVMVSPHIRTKLLELKQLSIRYPNACFQSLYPDRNPADILNNISICLALFSNRYSITLKNGKVTVKIGRSIYSSDYNSLDRSFYYSIRHRRFPKIKTINPSLKHKTFNAALNEL